jgi:hypothetical protein
MSTPAVHRAANGRLLSGASLNPGGRPVSAVTELRARYSSRLPELFDALMEMAMNSQNEMVKLGAIRLALDHLIGKPQISIDAVTTKFDFGTAYLEALRRVNSRVVEGKADTAGQTRDGGSINGSVGAANDPTQ